MPAFLVLPLDLTPTALVYRDDLPEDIDDVIEDCLDRWRRGDIDSAIGRAKEAQVLAEAYNHHISISVTSVLLMDLYREQDQLGLLPLGPQLRMKAKDALRLQPGYEHRYHAEAVIDYLWGLLNHTSGTNTGALSNYRQALASFEKAVGHWSSNIVRNPTQAGKYKVQIGKCEKAIKWINVLRVSLTDDLSPTRDRTEVHIPATNGRVYKLVRLKLAASVPPPRAPSPVIYLRPQEIMIDKYRYQLHHPSNGAAYSNNLKILGDERHFALRIPENEWAGAQSEEGDYVLVTQEKQMRERVAQILQGPPPQPRIAGVLRKEDQQEWKYGEFTYDAEGVRFHPFPPVVIGGAPQEEEVKDQDIGVVSALLKSV